MHEDRPSQLLQLQSAQESLQERFGPTSFARRLALESDIERVDRGSEGWASPIDKLLRAIGLYERGRINAERIQIKHHTVRAANLPAAFDGFTILHITDLHIDMNLGVVETLLKFVDQLEYDVCVLTGDYRGKTFGAFDIAMDGLARLRPNLGELVYGVLGNHDSILMVPTMEDMGVQMLLNESAVISRGDERLFLAGIDDAHLYRTHDIAKAVSRIPRTEFSILLSHTPEIYQEASLANFDLLLSGHTHGGQICLPGSIPITLFADVPRLMGAGSWRYGTMQGYTSVGLGSSLVPVRFNCLPEITLHHLQLEEQSRRAE